MHHIVVSAMWKEEHTYIPHENKHNGIMHKHKKNGAKPENNIESLYIHI